MHEVHGGALDVARQTQHAAERDVLGHGAVDQRHVLDVGAALALQPLVHVHDEVVVLGVDRQDAAVLGRLLHDDPQVTEPDHPALADRPHVGGEDLQAGEAGLDGLGNLIDDLRRHRALQHHVQRVIRVARAPDLLLLLDRPSDRHARLPDGEVHERGGAAADGGAADLLGWRAQRVPAAERRDRPVRVHVRVDASGDDELAGGVDDAGDVAGQRAGRGDGDDAFALDADVPGADALGSDHLSTTDHEIEHGYSLLSSPAPSPSTGRCPGPGKSCTARPGSSCWWRDRCGRGGLRRR